MDIMIHDGLSAPVRNSLLRSTEYIPRYLIVFSSTVSLGLYN